MGNKVPFVCTAPLPPGPIVLQLCPDRTTRNHFTADSPHMAESSLKTLEKACGRNIAESLYNKVSKKVFLNIQTKKVNNFCVSSHRNSPQTTVNLPCIYSLSLRLKLYRYVLFYILNFFLRLLTTCPRVPPALWPAPRSGTGRFMRGHVPKCRKSRGEERQLILCTAGGRCSVGSATRLFPLGRRIRGLTGKEKNYR